MWKFHGITLTLAKSRTACLFLHACFHRVVPSSDLPVECTEFELQCNNGACVDIRLKCNGQDDCGDGTDELNCGECESITTNHFLKIQMLTILIQYNMQRQDGTYSL